jgi:hypothetical protein
MSGATTLADEVLSLRAEVTRLTVEAHSHAATLRRRDDWVAMLQRQCAALKAEKCDVRALARPKNKRVEESARSDAARAVRAFAEGWQQILDLLPSDPETRAAIDGAFWRRWLLSTHDDKLQGFSERSKLCVREVFVAVCAEREKRR